MIDAHAHLDKYEENLPDVLLEIAAEQIFTISNSMDIPSWERNVKIAEGCCWVLPTFGIHPWNAPEYASNLERLQPLIDETLMIGEIGLDFHFIKDASTFALQEKLLDCFLSAAKKQKKIVNLHTKGLKKRSYIISGDVKSNGLSSIGIRGL